MVQIFGVVWLFLGVLCTVSNCPVLGSIAALCGCFAVCMAFRGVFCLSMYFCIGDGLKGCKWLLSGPYLFRGVRCQSVVALYLPF